MNKYFLICFLAFTAQGFSAQNDTEQGVKSAIEELRAVLRSNPSADEESAAEKVFFKKIESLTANQSLNTLLRENQYFNTAFGQITDEIGSRFSDRLFQASLVRDDFYNPTSGPETILANNYLKKRFDLKLDEKIQSALFGAFVDSKFLNELNHQFKTIIFADSEDKKLEAEGKTISFLENYKYRPWMEVLEEKQNRVIKRNGVSKNEIETTNGHPSESKHNSYSKTNIADKGGHSQESSSWFGWWWGVIGIMVTALSIYFLKKK